MTLFENKSTIFDDFIQDLKTTGRERTAKSYSSLLRKFVRWLEENNYDSNSLSFRKSDIRSFLEEMEDDWSNRSRNTFLRVLKSWADFHRDEIPIGETPEEIRRARRQEKICSRLRNVRPYKTSKHQVETLSVDELESLMKAQKKRDACFFYIYFYTGMRLGEIKRIQEIKWNGLSGSMKILTEKRDVPRTVPFDENAGKVWKRITENGWNELHVDTIGRIFRRYRESVDIKLSAHTARRTFRTQMRQQGVDDATVKYLMGHKQSGISDEHYLELYQDELKQAMFEDHYFQEMDAPLNSLINR